MLSGASSNNLGDGGRVDGATGVLGVLGVVKETATPHVKQTPRKKLAAKQPAGGGVGGGGRGERGGVRHRYGGHTWCAGLVEDPQEPGAVSHGALEVGAHTHVCSRLAHTALALASSSSSSSSSALLRVEGGGHGTWHGTPRMHATCSNPRSHATGDDGDVLEQQRISISSTPKVLRGAPEGGQSERGRVATGGGTTAGSGGGGGVGRQEMEMEMERLRERARERPREREKMEMEIRAARPSSPHGRCAREEWGHTGLRVREWLLARVQAAGVSVCACARVRACACALFFCASCKLHGHARGRDGMLDEHGRACCMPQEAGG